MGARYARRLGRRFELRGRRGAVCDRRRALPACAGASVPGAAGRLPRGAALRWSSEGGQLGRRSVPHCRGRHERRRKPRRGAGTCAAATAASAATRFAGARLSARCSMARTPNRCAARASRPSTGATSSWCWSHYLARADGRRGPLASPLLAELSGLPPALHRHRRARPTPRRGRALRREAAAGRASTSRSFASQVPRTASSRARRRGDQRPEARRRAWLDSRRALRRRRG